MYICTIILKSGTMKTIKIFLLALFATATMNAQELVKVNVPMSYTEGLLKVYPKATNIEWERSNDNYKVQFVDGNLEHTIHFNKNGDKVRLEAEMVKTTIPAVLEAAIEKDYADYTIDSVHSVVKNGVTSYEVVLQKKDWVEEIYLRFSEGGEVLGSNKY